MGHDGATSRAPLSQPVTNYLLFGLFAVTLLGIARFHKYAVQIALTGLVGTLIIRFAVGFPPSHHNEDGTVLGHFGGEWKELVNLSGLLLGFALLAV